MAKKRIISADLNHDENLNSCCIESQLLFFRLLTISDDFGIIPGNQYELKTRLNLPSKISNRLIEYLQELVNYNILQEITVNNKLFYCFKRDSFDIYQWYLVKNRTRSEYLKMDSEEFTVNYSNFRKVNGEPIISKEIKVKSIKIKDDSLCLFKNSIYFNKDKFINEFDNNNDYQKYDTEYYYESIKNWSDANGKMKKDWIATARTWALRDDKEGKPKLRKLKAGEVEIRQ